MNLFSSASTLFAFLYCTAYSIRRGQEVELLLFSYLEKEGKTECNNLTGYSPAKPQPQAGAIMHYCYLQIFNNR